MRHTTWKCTIGGSILNIVNGIGIIFSFIMTFIMPIGIVGYCITRKIIKWKYLFLGIVLFIFLRSITLPVIYTILRILHVQLGNTLTKSLMDVFILTILAINGKKIYYSHVLHIKKEQTNALFSLAIGEAVAECLLFLLPTAMNQFMYFFELSFGNIYEYLGHAYAKETIDSIVHTFNQLPISYHFYIGCLGIALLLVQIYVAMHILHDDAATKRKIYCVVALFYMLYILVCLYSYAVTDVMFIIMAIFILQSLRKQLRISKKAA